MQKQSKNWPGVQYPLNNGRWAFIKGEVFMRDNIDYSVVLFLSSNLYFTQVNILQALKTNLQTACIFTPLNIFTSLKTRLEIQWLHQIIFVGVGWEGG